MAKKKSQQKEPTAKQLESEKEQQIEILVSGLEKDFGEGVVMSDNVEISMRRFDKQISSGSIGLDMIIGPMYRRPDGFWQRGFGTGRIVEVFGPEGSGKTTTMLHIIANAQLSGGRAGFQDMEHALDTNYAYSLGVSVKDLLLSQPNTGEECLEITERMLRSNLLDVVCVDSVAALVPKCEIEGDMGDSTMGAQARLMSQAMRKFQTAMNQQSKTLLMFSNQLRSKMGQGGGYGPTETTTGGSALKYASSWRLDVRRGQQITNKQGQRIGHEVIVKIVKNKVAPPYRETAIPMIYGRGFDNFLELVRLCVLNGIIETSGSWYKYNGVTIAQGEADASDLVRADHGLRYELYNNLLTKHVNSLGFDAAGDPLPGFDFSKSKSDPSESLFTPYTPDPATALPAEPTNG